VSPNQRLSSSQLPQATEHTDAVTSPNIGIKLPTPEHESVQKVTIVWESPGRCANIRVRRSNYGSKLLQSPARAGYTTRMRQMFKDAGNGHHEQRSNTVVMYPQLPNISRKADPPAIRSPSRSSQAQQVITHASPKYRLESLCLSPKLPLAVSSAGAPHASILHTSEGSSGSWSDDAGYLVMTRARSHSSTVSQNERIRVWLLELPDRETDAGQNDTKEEQHSTSNARGHYINVSIFSETLNKNDERLSSPMDDPFVCEANASSPTESQDHGSSTAVLDCRPLRNIADICRLLNLNYLNQTHTTPLKQRSDTPPQHQESIGKAKSKFQDSEPLEAGGVQLSPLSPNVCVERGLSRYHSPRKPCGKDGVVHQAELVLSQHFKRRD
jgi:hypothetical protein